MTMKIEAKLILPFVSKHPLSRREIEINKEYYDKATDKELFAKLLFLSMLEEDGELEIEYKEKP